MQTFSRKILDANRVDYQYGATNPMSRGIINGDVTWNDESWEDYDPSVTYLVAIHINRYRKPTEDESKRGWTQWEPLACPNNDADSLISLLITKYGFHSDNIATLENEEATRENIIRFLSHYRSKLNEDHNLIIFFAGHGVEFREFEQGFWIPHDAVKGDEAGYIPNSQLKDYFAGMRTRHLLVISDSCYSASLKKRGTAEIVDWRIACNNMGIPNCYKRPSKWLFASGDDPVRDNAGNGHSPFMERLLQYFKAPSDNVFGCHDLASFLRKGGLQPDPFVGPLEYNGPHSGGEMFFCILQTGGVVPALPEEHRHFANASSKKRRNKKKSIETIRDFEPIIEPRSTFNWSVLFGLLFILALVAGGYWGYPMLSKKIGSINNKNQPPAFGWIAPPDWDAEMDKFRFEFTVSDTEDDNSILEVKASSSSPNIMPNENIKLTRLESHGTWLVELTKATDQHGRFNLELEGIDSNSATVKKIIPLQVPKPEKIEHKGVCNLYVKSDDFRKLDDLKIDFTLTNNLTGTLTAAGSFRSRTNTVTNLDETAHYSLLVNASFNLNASPDEATLHFPSIKPTPMGIELDMLQRVVVRFKATPPGVTLNYVDSRNGGEKTETLGLREFSDHLSPKYYNFHFHKPGYTPTNVTRLIYPSSSTEFKPLIEVDLVPQSYPDWQLSSHVNTLGQHFSRMDNVFVGRNEVSWQEMKAYHESQSDASKSKYVTRITASGYERIKLNWKELSSQQQASLPAHSISYIEIQDYCNWLTQIERQQNHLRPNEYYRLPTNEEYDKMFRKVGTERKGYAWDEWDYYIMQGNFAGGELIGDSNWPKSWPVLAKEIRDRWLIKLSIDKRHPKQLDPQKIHSDPFIRLSPTAGDLTSAAYEDALKGFTHLLGNLSEWSNDKYSSDTVPFRLVGDHINQAEKAYFINASPNAQSVRGASFKDHDLTDLHPMLHKHAPADEGFEWIGFRLVIAESL